MPAFFAASTSALTTSFFSFGTMYRGAKSLSTSTPRRDFGRSRTCPTEARTSYSLPRMLESVRAFAGDSTMTRLLLGGLLGHMFYPARLRLALLYTRPQPHNRLFGTPWPTRNKPDTRMPALADCGGRLFVPMGPWVHLSLAGW